MKGVQNKPRNGERLYKNKLLDEEFFLKKQKSIPLSMFDWKVFWRLKVLS